MRQRGRRADQEDADRGSRFRQRRRSISANHDAEHAQMRQGDAHDKTQLA